MRSKGALAPVFAGDVVLLASGLATNTRTLCAHLSDASALLLYRKKLSLLHRWSRLR